MSKSSPRRNPFFPLAAFLSALFVTTILALVAAMFGDPQAPAAGLVEKYAGHVLVAEVVAILVTAWLALVVDRRQNRADRLAAAAGTSADDDQGSAAPPLCDSIDTHA
ncbi:MAG: hypothetical protein ACT4QC_22625 [Planctomycetaceae bacterium]